MTEVLPLNNNSHLPVRLRLEDYLLLDESGAFAEYRKTELIEGEIFFMNAQHRPHAVIKSRLSDCSLPLWKRKIKTGKPSSKEAQAAGVCAQRDRRIWVVDVERRLILQMWAPQGEDRAKSQRIPFGALLSAATISGLTVETVRL